MEGFFDKSYKIQQIRKDLEKYPKFLDWFLTTDKIDHKITKTTHKRLGSSVFELGRRFCLILVTL